VPQTRSISARVSRLIFWQAGGAPLGVRQLVQNACPAIRHRTRRRLHRLAASLLGDLEYRGPGLPAATLEARDAETGHEDGSDARKRDRDLHKLRDRLVEFGLRFRLAGVEIGCDELERFDRLRGSSVSEQLFHPRPEGH